jgi:hypothetical protein
MRPRKNIYIFFSLYSLRIDGIQAKKLTFVFDCRKKTFHSIYQSLSRFYAISAYKNKRSGLVEVLCIWKKFSENIGFSQLIRIKHDMKFGMCSMFKDLSIL